jgi:hypothetical protein
LPVRLLIGAFDPSRQLLQGVGDVLGAAKLVPLAGCSGSTPKWFCRASVIRFSASSIRRQCPMKALLASAGLRGFVIVTSSYAAPARCGAPDT